jgi:hypothetical protein
MEQTLKRDHTWEIVNGSVEVGSLSRLPLSERCPIRSCRACENLFSCARTMYPWKTKDLKGQDKIVYECEYQNCEFRCPAEWAEGSTEFSQLLEKRISWSREKLTERGKEFPGKYRPQQKR